MNTTNSTPNPNANDGVSESTWTESVTKFEELELAPELLRGIFGYGFMKPSVIQQKGILPLLKGKDTIAQAQSGSGKTGAFSIGALQLIDPKVAKPQAMILAPTRELADQIYKVNLCLASYMDIKIHKVVGGTDIRATKDALREGVHMVVGTPGRVKDMVKRGHLDLTYLKIFILDEADDLLGKGFLEQINEILKQIPSDSQIAFFSATMPPEVVKLSESVMNDPAKILVKNDQLTLDGIKQFYISCSNDDVKFDNMNLIFMNMEMAQCMIYVNKRDKAEYLAKKMREAGHVVGCMHGAMEQQDRNMIMNEFRSASTRVLITTDLLARGIDVQPVGLVINFDLPTQKECYIHRVGRSGRFGRRGIAINLISKLEARQMIDIEQHYSTQVSKLPDDLSELE
jgi:translation initiation factor 4A